MTRPRRYATEHTLRHAEDARFNEWYATPVELMSDDQLRRHETKIAAPWFRNFGSSSSLLAHMRPTVEYGSAAAREDARHGRPWQAPQRRPSYLSDSSTDTADLKCHDDPAPILGQRFPARPIAALKKVWRKRHLLLFRPPKIPTCFSPPQQPPKYHL